MRQHRYTPLWRLLGVSACLSVFFTATLALWGGDSHREASHQATQPSHLHKPPTESSLAATLPHPPEDLREDDVSFAEINLSVEPEQPATGPVQAAGIAEAFAPPRKIDTQVVAASALEEILPAASGPSPSVRSEAPGEATAEQPSSPAVARQPAAQAAAVPPEHPTASPPFKLTLLPEWLRHLPELVASIPEAVLDPSPAKEPTSKPAPTPQPKSAPESAPMPEPAAKPQPPAKQKVDDSWQEPEALIASLNELNGTPAGKWSAAVLRQLAALKPAIAAGSDEATAILDRLDQLSQQTVPLTAKLSDRAFARKWREMGYALARRIDIWRQVVRLEKTEASDFVSPTLDSQKLADCLADAEAATNDSAQGKGWQAFLLLDDLRQYCVKQSPRDERLSRAVAGRALVADDADPVDARTAAVHLFAAADGVAVGTLALGGPSDRRRRIAPRRRALRVDAPAERRPAAGRRLPGFVGVAVPGPASTGRAGRYELSQRQLAVLDRRRSFSTI